MNRLLILIFLHIVLLLPAKLYGNPLNGLWKIEEQKSSGGVHPSPEFRFIDIDGSKARVSNGGDWVDSWIEVEGNTLTLVSGYSMAWKDSVYCDVFKSANFALEGDKLTIKYSYRPDRDPPDKEWSLKRITEGERERLAFNARTKEQEETLDLLTKLGFKFAFDEQGFATEVDPSMASSFEERHLRLLEKLPKLTGITKKGKAKGGPANGIFNQLAEMQKKADEDKRNALRSTTAGKAFNKGRVAMAELPKLDQNRGKIFFAQSRKGTGGAPAFLVPFREKVYAFHRRFPREEVPTTMKSPGLKVPVPLGRVILDHLGFQIRAFSGNPGKEWIFEPFPRDKLALYTGRKVKVIGIGGSTTAYSNLLLTYGQEWIPPEVPLDWRLFDICLIDDPDAEVSIWSGCPVVDDETGYLIGITSRYKIESDTKMIDVVPIWDVLTVGVSPIQGKTSFFGVKKANPSELTRFSGVFSDSILSIELGTTPYIDEVMSKPEYLFSSNQLLLGRQYLFSKATVHTAGSPEVGDIELSGRHVRIDDERVKNYINSIVRFLGEPNHLYSSDSTMGIGFHWIIADDKQVFTRLKLSEIDNSLDLSFRIFTKGKAEEFYGLKKIEGGMARNEIEKFLEDLKKMDAEPRSFIKGAEMYAKEMENLLDLVRKRIQEQ